MGKAEFVLSPQRKVAEKYARTEERHGDELDYAGTYLGSHDLESFLEGRELDDPALEEFLSPDLMERIKQIPAFRARFDQARAEGEAKGQLAGEARGEARGEGESLLRFFRVRGDDVAPDTVERIRACTDPVVLADWQERAYRGETSGQIFG
jgi:hypothetical protein